RSDDPPDRFAESHVVSYSAAQNPGDVGVVAIRSLARQMSNPYAGSACVSNKGATGSVVISCRSPSTAAPPRALGQSGVSQITGGPLPERRLRDARGKVRCPRRFFAADERAACRGSIPMEVWRWGMPGSHLFSMR